MRTERLDYLDSLRAVAALLVVSFHLPLIARGHPLPLPVWADSFLRNIGSSGVDLFFVLSAYLLTILMPTYEAAPRPLTSFYLKRFFRIAPLFYAVVAYWVILGSRNGAPPNWPRLMHEVTFTFNLNPIFANGTAFAGWTVGVEMLFYAIFPFLFRTLTDARLRLAALLFAIPLYEVVILALSYLPLDPAVLKTYQAITIFRHLPAFLLGMLAVDIFRFLQARRDARAIGLILMACALVLFSGAVSGRPIFGRYNALLGWSCILLSAGLFPWFFVNGATAFIGRISFSIYLLHGPIIVQMGSVFSELFALGVPRMVSFTLSVTLALAVIIPVSWLSFKLIETPGIWLGAAIVRNLRRKAELSNARRGAGIIAAVPSAPTSVVSGSVRS